MKTRVFALCKMCLLVVLLAVFLPGHAQADSEVSAPYVTKGKLKFQSRSEYLIDESDSIDGSFEQIFEAGYGVTDYLFLEAGVQFNDEPGEDIEIKDIILEAKVQFTEKDEYFVDVGAKLEYKYNTDGGTDKLKGKLLFAKEIGKFANLANVALEYEVGEGSSDRSKFKLDLQSKYKFSPYFQPGIEYFGDFKDTTKEFEDQEHVVGPVAFGKIKGTSLKYEAGALFGVTHKSPDATLKLNLKYKF